MPDRDIRQHVLRDAESVVVKVGTSAVCGEDGRPVSEAIAALAAQIARVMDSGVRVTLVASGAIGAGLGELELPRRPRQLPQLQAVAAVGQGQLMRTFHDAFKRRGVRVAQVLVTRDAFEDRTRYLNIRNTLTALGEYGALPIVNENDTVAVEEIRFGDNDMIAAHITNMLQADALVLLTNVDGVLAEGRVLDVLERIDEASVALTDGTRSRLGSGGMRSKLEAAGLVTAAGEVAVIANAREKRILGRLLAGERLGTVIIPAGRKMSSRRRWIGQASRARGKILVDAGAAIALAERGKSLLPSGIVAVQGRFAKGDTVAILGPHGREIARGLTNYSADQVDRIKGLKSGQIAQALGDAPYDVVVHRDNMAT